MTSLDLSDLLSRLDLSGQMAATLPVEEDMERQDQDTYSQAVHKMVTWPRDQEKKVRSNLS